MAQACAILSERHLLPARTASTTSDLLSAIDQWATLPGHVRQTAESLVSGPNACRSPNLNFDALSLPGIPIAWRNARTAIAAPPAVLWRRCRDGTAKRGESTASSSSRSTSRLRRARTIPMRGFGLAASSIANG